MLCPACGSDNLPGADRCDDCMQPLAKLDVPRPTIGFQQRLMEDSVSHLNPAPPIGLPGSAPVSEAIQTMKEHRVGCVLVLEENKLAGILTERDLLYKVAGNDRPLNEIRIRDVMTARPVTLSLDDSIRFAIYQMSVGGFRHIPILESNQPVGIISIKDVLRYLCHSVQRKSAGG